MSISTYTTIFTLPGTITIGASEIALHCLLLPILIIISSGLSIFMATIAEHFPDFMVLSTTVKLLISLSPYFLSSLLFTGLYVYMPNTNVELRHALIPGIIAGIAFQFLQYFYIHSQIWVSSYNAIYGSFAALPMFMLWVNFSWIICLLGAQLCYANQNLRSYYYIKDVNKISRSYHDLLTILIMSKICKRFEKGMRPYTVYGLSVETALPLGIVSKITHELNRMHLVIIENNDENAPKRFSPAEDINKLSVSFLMDRIDKFGNIYTPSIYHADKNKWEELIKVRSQYINTDQTILLKDL